MITIDQLLESVDLDFQPRWVTISLDELHSALKEIKQLTQGNK